MPDILCKRSIRWLPEYAIGVKQVDEEHQALFALLDKLHQGISAGNDLEILICILDELVAYTCYHFAHEEELMEKIQYPYYLDHCRQHEDLRLRVLAMKERAPAGEDTLLIEVMQFLIDWLKGHTTTSDRRIGSYMRRCGLVS
jgi:hemerythrin-like metal-binding protein